MFLEPQTFKMLIKTAGISKGAPSVGRCGLLHNFACKLLYTWGMHFHLSDDKTLILPFLRT